MGSIGKATIEPNFQEAGRLAAWVGRDAVYLEPVVREARGVREGFEGLT